MIEAVFLDLDDTIGDAAGTDRQLQVCVLEFLSTNIGPQALQIINRYKSLLSEAPYDPTRRIPALRWRERFWEVALRENGVTQKDILRQLCSLVAGVKRNTYRLLPGARRLLNWLRSHHRVGLITNGDSSLQRQKISACGLDGFFDCVVIGERSDEAKPAPRVFADACTAVGCGTYQAVHIGDQFDTDILGAANAGFAGAVWVTRIGAVSSLGGLPLECVPFLNQVPDALRVLSSRAQCSQS